MKNCSGAVSFEVLQPPEFKKKSDELERAYVEAMREYSKLSGEEKKQAARPARPAMRKVKVLNDKDAAAKCLTALREQYEKLQERTEKGREG